MDAPKPAEQHRQLEKFVGKWSGTDRIFPSPWMAEGLKPASCEIKPALDGFFLLMDYAQYEGGNPGFAGLGVIGYDVKQGCFTMHWFDSWGAPPSTFGKGRLEGDVLTIDSEYPDHKGRVIYHLRGDTLVQRVEMDMDGKGYKPMIEGTYRRA